VTQQETILKLIAENQDTLSLAKQAKNLADEWQKAYEAVVEQLKRMESLYKLSCLETQNYRKAASAAINAAEIWRDKCKEAKAGIAEMQKVRLD